MTQYDSVATMWQYFTTTGLPGQVSSSVRAYVVLGRVLVLMRAVWMLMLMQGSVGPSPSGKTWNGALAVTRTLAPNVRRSDCVIVRLCVCDGMVWVGLSVAGVCCLTVSVACMLVADKHYVHVHAWVVLSQPLCQLRSIVSGHPNHTHQLLDGQSGMHARVQHMLRWCAVGFTRSQAWYLCD
jgi:hypothetical protein